VNAEHNSRSSETDKAFGTKSINVIQYTFHQFTFSLTGRSQQQY
jgi:hypothetical protein